MSPTKKCFPKTEMSVGRNSPLPGRDSAYSSELVICSAYLHALNAHLVGGVANKVLQTQTYRLYR